MGSFREEVKNNNYMTNEGCFFSKRVSENMDLLINNIFSCGNSLNVRLDVFGVESSLHVTSNGKCSSRTEFLNDAGRMTDRV